MPRSHGDTLDGIQTVALGEARLLRGGRGRIWRVIVTWCFRSDDFTILLIIIIAQDVSQIKEKDKKKRGKSFRL
ncbi:hypothetical protein CEXT_794641 [Caerostris extrusa]|uniref:Uncharacterized protein n=1 Tax=Caerostris extrusa TaxID=172846 RepID=A0AAV4TP37_CAEEX|nr:hypothetical protein CEXT_794641 [Caerostris extrusa]